MPIHITYILIMFFFSQNTWKQILAQYLVKFQENPNLEKKKILLKPDSRARNYDQLPVWILRSCFYSYECIKCHEMVAIIFSIFQSTKYFSIILYCCISINLRCSHSYLIISFSFYLSLYLCPTRKILFFFSSEVSLPNFPFRIESIFSDILITSSLVSTIISKLDPHKECGPDGKKTPFLSYLSSSLSLFYSINSLSSISIFFFPSL